MRHPNRRPLGRLFGLAMLASLLLSQGCALDFSADNFQRLKTFFELTVTLTKGEAALVHTWFFPSEVGVKKRWVQVSGRATVPDDGALPSTATVIARFEDAESGKKLQVVKLKVKIKADGSFSARKKIKKDIAADALMLVTVQPAGNDLEAGTGLTLCVDLAASKGDLGDIPDCVEEDGGGEAATLTELQNDFFTPTCDSFGCHNPESASAGLVLRAGLAFDNLVDVPSMQEPDFDRVEPGDAENSYLIKKLRGDPDISGARMPDGGPFLSDEEIARFISWINAGAPNN